MATCWASFALLTSLALVALPAHAQDHALEELDLVRLLNVRVSTATKTAETVDDAPAVITVVTYDDIVRWGYQSVGEVLQHTVGFYVLDDHILPNVGVRGVTGGLGAESGVIKVMIDGRSVSYRSTSGNWLGVELVPLESVEQIEIIRGPASALYGADAFLGVVNIITRKPDNLRPVRARVLGGVTGANPGGQFDVAGGGSWGPWGLRLGAAAEYKDRTGLRLPEESPAPVLPANVGRRTTRDLSRRSLVLHAGVGYQKEAWGHVAVDAYAHGLERGGDFAHWAQLTHGKDADGRDVGTTVALGHYRVNLDALFHVYKTVDVALQSTYFEGGVLPNDRVEIASDVFYVERKLSYRGNDSTLEARWVPNDSFNAILGGEILFDREQLPDPERVHRVTGESVAVRAGADSGASSVDLVNLGAYLSTNYKLIEEWLKLTGGVRFDHHSKYGDKLTGRLGLTSRLLDSLVVKALYGSAFKAPSPYLLYAVPLRPGDVSGNAGLKPQYIHTVEGQVSFVPWKVLSATTGLSHSWLLDKAEFTPQGINQAATNVSKQRSLSWESRVNVRYRDDLDGYASFELVRSRRDLGEEEYAARLVGGDNVVYPPWIARLGAAVRIPSAPAFPLEAAFQGMLVGPRRAADTSIVENGGSFTLPTYALLNLSLSTRELYLIRGHESRIALRARNVLGSDGPDPGFSGFELPLAPRELMLELRHVY
jgi:outer membrane receptor for ferrienterochelin and colicins